MNDSVWVHWRPNSKPFPRLPRSVVISPGQDYFRKPEMSVEQRLGQRRHRSQRRSLPQFMVREASRISCAYFMCFSFWNYILWYSGLVVQNVFVTMYPMTGVFLSQVFLVLSPPYIGCVHFQGVLPRGVWMHFVITSWICWRFSHIFGCFHVLIHDVGNLVRNNNGNYFLWSP